MNSKLKKKFNLSLIVNLEPTIGKRKKKHTHNKTKPYSDWKVTERNSRKKNLRMIIC